MHAVSRERRGIRSPELLRAHVMAGAAASDLAGFDFRASRVLALALRRYVWVNSATFTSIASTFTVWVYLQSLPSAGTYMTIFSAGVATSATGNTADTANHFTLGTDSTGIWNLCANEAGAGVQCASWPTLTLSVGSWVHIGLRFTGATAYAAVLKNGGLTSGTTQSTVTSLPLTPTTFYSFWLGRCAPCLLAIPAAPACSDGRVSSHYQPYVPFFASDVTCVDLSHWCRLLLLPAGGSRAQDSTWSYFNGCVAKRVGRRQPE